MHPTEGTERRFALRLTLADSNYQCTVVLYHELVLRAAADMDAALPEGVQDTQPVRAQLRDLFRSGCVASPSGRMITSRHWSWNVDT